MKARNENNTIVLYPELPIHYSSATLGTPLVDFRTMSDDIHESEGFFDVIIPDFDYYTQKLGKIYWDEVNKIFTYPIEILDIPIPRSFKRETILTPKQFLSRFTLSEWENIENACTQSSAMRFWMKKYDKSQDIDLEDQETIDGINAMVTFSLVTEERKNEIMKINVIIL